eukprot:NODE_4058_length_306_cov_4.023346_g3387_i0.p3 GENE.NODE_4058_length_306_cov_4.023346_g3387_i0~~NODE_4058_length_306_cov_4.023346_g3387_i0.p3  ORF type:complete len:67 (+),score=29.04 NODE_4058_length_306_cov_4.023346_g3387_i0:5-205(+)
MGVHYSCGNFWRVYQEMLETFNRPRHLGKDVQLYPGKRTTATVTNNNNNNNNEKEKEKEEEKKKVL